MSELGEGAPQISPEIPPKIIPSGEQGSKESPLEPFPASRVVDSVSNAHYLVDKWNADSAYFNAQGHTYSIDKNFGVKLETPVDDPVQHKALNQLATKWGQQAKLEWEQSWPKAKNDTLQSETRIPETSKGLGGKIRQLFRRN